MLEKLKSLSTIVLIPGIVLYFFGFICIDSYLARFGIVSFDIVNARFITAGIYPFISLVVAVLIAWHIYRELYTGALFGFSRWKGRYGFYFRCLLYISGTSIGLTQFFNLGKYAAPTAAQTIDFAPLLGKSDLIGRAVVELPTGLTGSADSILKRTLYIFSYAVAVTAIIALSYFLVTLWRRYMSTARVSRVTEGPGKLVGNPVEQDPRTKPLLVPIFAAIDMLALSLFVSLVFWSLARLKIAFFDFQSFGKPLALTDGLVFAWMYSSVFTLGAFLMWLRPSSQQLTFDLVRQMNHPFSISQALQVLITPLIIAIFTFGVTIFPRIPFSTGGGEPREVKLQTKAGDDLFSGQKIYLIGESNQFLFIVDGAGGDRRALQINKDTIGYIETRRAH